MDKQRILVLAPHTDDAEIGAGGSIAKWSDQHKEIVYLVFSAANNRARLMEEQANASSKLGVSRNNIEVLSYQVREFYDFRQDILDAMISVNKRVRPDLVLCPSSNSTHQDHEVIYNEAFRAFKDISIIGYEDIWNNRTFNTDMFSVLSNKDIERKVSALACYKTQAGKIYTSKEFTESLARTRGGTIKREFAEVFEVIRWIV